jgi:hypothetical protein
MTEAQDDLKKDLEKKLRERNILLDAARREKDSDSETYQKDMIQALETALASLKG